MGIGYQAVAGNSGIAIGYGATAGAKGVCIASDGATAYYLMSGQFNTTTGATDGYLNLYTPLQMQNRSIIGASASGQIDDSSTDITIDWGSGNYHEVKLETANINAIKFHNVSVGQKLALRIENDNAGARSIGWTVTSSASTTSLSSATINWPGGTAPTLTATVDKADVYGFICRTATLFDGFVVGQNI